MKVPVYCTIGAIVKHYALLPLFLAGSLLLAGCREMSEAAPPPVPAVITVPVKAPQPAAEAKQRVVIIRRPASEAAEIPLMEEKSAEVAA